MLNTFKKIISYSIIYTLFSCGNQAKEDAKGLFIRGNIAMKELNYKVAIQKFDDCIEKTPDFPDCYNNRGLAKIKTEGNSSENIASAILDFKKAVEIDNKFYQAQYNLATALNNIGQYEESLESLKSLEKMYKDSSFYHVLIGINQSKLNRFSEATSEFNKAISLNKNNFEAFTNLGFVQFQEKHYNEAKSNFERALAINPQADFALNNLALLKITGTPTLSDYQNALTFVNKAIDINSNQPYYLNNKGYILLNLNQDEEGKKLIEQSLKIDDKNAWAYRNLGIFYLKNNDFAKALTNFQTAEKLDAGVEKINYYIGTTLTKMGKNEESKKYFEIEKKLN